MNTHVSMVWGTFLYEFRMQLRCRVLWIVMGLLMGITLYLQRGPTRILLFNLETWHGSTLLPAMAIATWADYVNRLLPIAVGVVLADRFPRDRQTRVDELLTTLPAGLGVRLLGKYLGSTCATILPVFLYYSLGIGVLFARVQSLMIFPIALFAFATILLPGLLFVGAFSIACPAFLWWPLYCFCFAAYWFWGNLLSPLQHIPTISTTILTPIGGYMSQGFFGVAAYGANANATPLQGVESLILLLTLAFVALLLTWGLLRWKQSRQ